MVNKMSMGKMSYFQQMPLSSGKTRAFIGYHLMHKYKSFPVKINVSVFKALEKLKHSIFEANKCHQIKANNPTIEIYVLCASKKA